MRACTGSRPERTSSSSALSRLVESLPSAQITGFSRSTCSSHRGEARAGSRARDRKSTRLNSQSQSNLVCRLLLEKKKHVLQHGTLPYDVLVSVENIVTPS